MIKSVDLDQLAYSTEVNRSGSKLFAKSGFSRTRVKQAPQQALLKIKVLYIGHFWTNKGFSG